MFLENISLILMSPCIADEAKIRFKAELSRDIAEMMPYLNAVIRNATYNPGSNTIFYTQGVRMITLRGKSLAVSKASDLTDAHKIMDFIKETVNHAYENKDKITPIYERRVRATALDIFSYLPRTNCKKCGEPTCLAFAVKLLLSELPLSACLPLNNGTEYADKLKEMTELVDAMGLVSR